MRDLCANIRRSRCLMQRYFKAGLYFKACRRQTNGNFVIGAAEFFAVFVGHGQNFTQRPRGIKRGRVQQRRNRNGWNLKRWARRSTRRRRHQSKERYTKKTEDLTHLPTPICQIIKDLLVKRLKTREGLFLFSYQNDIMRPTYIR